jgi:hypothetical protein
MNHFALSSCAGQHAAGIRRVDRQHPCPVCGHDHWCSLLIDELGEVWGALCAREALGSRRTCRNGAHLHVLREQVRPRPARARVSTVQAHRPRRGDLAELDARFRAAVEPASLGRLAASLGVSAGALGRLGVGWCAESRAWSFPMSGPDGRPRGIRLRTPAGRKFSVTGGREGLYIPTGLDTARALFVCEGLTDTAALLDLGFEAVGRPSCTGGVGHLLRLVSDRRPPAVVVVADRDDHGRGQDGAYELAKHLSLLCRNVRVMLPPPGVKDARAWVNGGATRGDLLEAARAARPVRLTVRPVRLTVTTDRPARAGGRGRGR